MIIGKFISDDAAYTGTVAVFPAASFSVRIVPSEKKGIDYELLTGDGLELGVAWKKTSGKGNGYLSVKLDSPLLPAAANCALLKQNDGSHALVWKRATSDAKSADLPEAEAA